MKLTKTIGELLAEPDMPTLWACTDLLPMGGITLLHGKTSVGKSPFTWEIARAISTGQDAFGLFTTTKCRVLYVDADTPEKLMRQRLKHLEGTPGDWCLSFMKGKGLDIALPTAKSIEIIKQLRAETNPEVIIWNTLRALTTANLSEGATVSRTYNNLEAFFPGATHLLVHHDRKESTAKDSNEVPDEAFSGSSGWRDSAQVALNIWKGGMKGQRHMFVRRTKSQVCAEMEEPFRLILEKDGTNWTLFENPKLTKIKTILAGPSLIDGMTQPDYIMHELKLSKAQTYKLIAQAKGES